MTLPLAHDLEKDSQIHSLLHQQTPLVALSVLTEYVLQLSALDIWFAAAQHDTHPCHLD